MRISDWSSDVCSSDLIAGGHTTGDTDWVSRMAYRGIGGHRENTIAHLDGEGARDGNRGRCNSGDAWKSRNRNDLERWTAASCASDRNAGDIPHASRHLVVARDR